MAEVTNTETVRKELPEGWEKLFGQKLDLLVTYTDTLDGCGLSIIVQTAMTQDYADTHYPMEREG